MRLAIFGGTGRVGRRLIEYARQDGHEIRALVRDAAKLPWSLDGVEPVIGDATDPEAVLTTLTGTDAVLSALGGAGLAHPGTILSEGMSRIVAAMPKVGIRRVLAVAGAGVLDEPAGGLRGEAPGFPEIYRAITQEHLGTWHALKASALDWTLVCCPDLMDGVLTREFRIAPDVLPAGGRSISVEDVAYFMLAELSSEVHCQRRVGVAY